MSSSGGFAVFRTLGGDRLYNPPAIRRHRQMLQQQKLLNQQIPRPVKSEAAAENRIDSDDSAATWSKPPSVSSASPPRPPTNATNLDRLVESVTPFVAAPR